MVSIVGVHGCSQSRFPDRQLSVTGRELNSDFWLSVYVEVPGSWGGGCYCAGLCPPLLRQKLLLRAFYIPCLRTKVAQVFKGPIVELGEEF